jgi:endonuclease III
MNKQNVNTLFSILEKINPTPTTELMFDNSFQLLVSVILSAQATDKSVNKATEKLFAHAATPADIHALGYEGLLPYIRSIGLFRSKAKHIIATCAILMETHHHKVPQTREALEALPGVGRKTANVILNTAFDVPCIGVDTHVTRVSIRTGLTPKAKTPLQVEIQLMKIIPKQYLKEAHHWLVLHGRYICVARQPKCNQCPIHTVCQYPNKTK